AAKQNVPGFIGKFQPTFPVGYGPRDSVYEYLQHPSMLILHMPAVVFIDKRGNILAQFEGDAPFFADASQGKNFRDTMEKMVKEGVTTGKTTPAKRGVARSHQ